MDKIDETIKIVAVKHGIAVGRNDPILVLQTINDRLMQESKEAQEEILRHFRSELEEIAHQWGDDAKNKAERTLNTALKVSRDTMLKGMEEGAMTAVKAVQDELEDFTNKLTTPIHTAQRIATMNMIAASMTIIAAGLVLWVAL